MPETTERRSERRRSVFLRAKIYGVDGAQITECAIMDASASGCKIISDSIGDIPDQIVITIRGLGETFAGRLVWRNSDMAGIEFVDRERAEDRAQ